MINAHTFPDRNQNFWQLMSIQSASQSIPGILIGGFLAQQYGESVALSSICIGNLILWLVGFGVITLAAKGRKNTIETVQGYLGKGSSYAIAAILLLAFLSWYMLQIQAAVDALSPIIPSKSGDLELGVLFGITTAILSMGGIKWIKWICVVGFPIVLLIAIYYILTSKISLSFQGNWQFSFAGIVAVIALTLPGVVNLPTFFRHSHSRSDALIALSLLTFFDAFFQIISIYLGFATPSGIFSSGNDHTIYFFSTLLLILITLICLNIVNIYFASAGFEKFMPKFPIRMGYLIIGLLGTGTYLFLQNASPMIFLVNLADNCIATLGIVLLTSFLVRIAVKHRERAYDQLISNICWITGSFVAMVMQLQSAPNSNQPLIGGISASIIAFIIVIFFEETMWSLKQLKANKTKRQSL